MGTSTVQRSPGTPRWRIVNNLYNDPNVSPARLLAEVFNAAEHYPTGLADAAVLERVETLLQVAAVGDWRRGTEAALAVAREAIRAAQVRTMQSGSTSFFGDLADRAMHTTLAHAPRDPESLSTPRAALSTFLRNLVACAIDHVVSRDVTAHMSGPRVASVTEALTLRRTLAEQARAIATDARVSAALEAAASSPRDHWPDVVRQVWTIGATPSSRDAEQGGR
jgi:hypothetical protein